MTSSWMTSVANQEMAAIRSVEHERLMGFPSVANQEMAAIRSREGEVHGLISSVANQEMAAIRSLMCVVSLLAGV